MSLISTYNLTPYRKSWDTDDLLHLLRRTLFGVGHKELAFFNNKDLGQCLDILLTPSLTPEPPVQEDPDITDPLVPKGMEWIKAPYENELIDNKRAEALRSWWVERIINRDYSITEKMILFWHNHFPVEMDMVKDARYTYRYRTMLQKHALGNFKKLIAEGTANPAMLVYLNGNTNHKEAPNENYSRELMELFTLGKGGEVKYTEDDVKAAARVLTGWCDDKQNIQGAFNPSRHDISDKRFSAYFNNRVIKGRAGSDGANETDEFIQMVFEKEAAAKFFCRNIYRWFVYGQIDDNVEQYIIEPLAQILITSNFEIISVLRTLLESEHFFDKAFRGCIEKSPVDFLVGVIQQFGVAFPASHPKNLLCAVIIHDFMGGLSMSIGNPPSVAGWLAYYQAPDYHRWWVNPSSLGLRLDLVNSLNSAGGMRCNGPIIKFDPFVFVNQFKNPENVNEFIEQCVELLFAAKISEKSKDKLKGILISAKDLNQEWPGIWQRFKTNPEDQANKIIAETKLRSLFKAMTNMVQYQMI